MLMKNIMIDGTGVYIPTNKVYNEQLVWSDTVVYATFADAAACVALGMDESSEKRLEWNPFPMDFIPGQWTNAITQILEKNSLNAKDIDYYIFSQLSDVYNMETLKLLGISEDDNKYYFVGKEYGYTGNTCPILCLNRLWDIYSKKGTKIIICTVGAGYSIIVQLYEF